MTKYIISARRQVWQEATLWVDAKSPAEALATMAGWHKAGEKPFVWHDLDTVKNSFEARAERSDGVGDDAHRKHTADIQEALDSEFGT